MNGTEPLRYRGIRADGSHSTGVETEDEAAELVEYLFDKGWRELVVTQGSKVVGAIERRRRQRVWWAES